MPSQPENGPVAGRLTFVVPTKNSARTIGACLESLASQTHDDIEVIVVDNSSTDGTFDIARSFTTNAITRGPERSAQRNHGLELASGEFVAFIDSDMILDRDIAAQAVDRFAADPAFGGLVIPELSFGEGIWAPARVLEKELYLGDPGVEAARVFRTDAVRSIGGYDERLIAREDWDLPDRLQLAGWQIGRVAGTVWHDEGQISIRTTFAKKRYYGQGAGDYSPTEQTHRTGLTGRIAPLAKAVAKHPVVGSRLLALKTAEFAGYTVGQFDGR